MTISSIDSADLESLANRMQAIAAIAMLAGRSKRGAQAAAMHDAASDPRRRQILEEVLALPTSLSGAAGEETTRLSRFVEDRVQSDAGSCVRASDILLALRGWWVTRHGLSSMPSQRSLGRALQAAGYRRIKRRGFVYYQDTRVV